MNLYVVVVLRSILVVKDASFMPLNAVKDTNTKSGNLEPVISDFQTAFMVATEMRAAPHYEHLLKLLEIVMEGLLEHFVAVSTRSIPFKHTQVIRKDLQNGIISMVVGTHCFISDSYEARTCLRGCHMHQQCIIS
ncbi:hypothetical protein M5689_020770 [Euphorbia peplus]|nr:hypothetical protein M5689_020770 [Euphorbia peplus]